jgi:hypothetical protein
MKLALESEPEPSQRGPICFPCVVGKCTTNKIVCRVFSYGARQTYTFVARFPTAHDKVFLKKFGFVLLFISPLRKHYFVLYN